MTDDFVIPLDWDNIGYETMIRRVEAFLLVEDFISEIEIRTSPSLDGYHLYIKTFYHLNPTLIFSLRFNWKDDYQKLCMDMINKKARYRNVLFNYKSKTKNGVTMKFPETKILKYFKQSPNTEWQVINHQQEFQKNGSQQLAELSQF